MRNFWLVLVGVFLGSASAQFAPFTPSLLTIPELRAGNYPGSTLRIERTLNAGSNYRRYIASYQSEGLKIYGLLTVPSAQKPRTGWPVIVFIHGYIPPAQYRTTERYVAYVDGFARNGYVVFRPDLRGHGSSEGEPSGAYWSAGYTVDVLNAVSTLAKHKEADPSRIGMWGHSMGGYLTLRAMVVDKRIKTGVIWAGVVAPYNEILNNWRRRVGTAPPPGALSRRQRMLEHYGTPENNPSFWYAATANNYIKGIGPIQLHHGDQDTSVPIAFSATLAQQLKSAAQPYEYFAYPGNDHNLKQSFSTAMRRSIAFFDRHLKNGG
jgi:dipeptidyl aminopeptidase/acylaminoacyl peptidase